MALSAIAIGVLCWAYQKRKIRRGLFLVLCATAVVGAFVIISEEFGGAKEVIREISRTEGEALLEVETGDGDIHEVTIQIPEKQEDPAAIRKKLSMAAEQLKELILGKNETAEHVCWNLVLPDVIGDTGVEAFWTTDRPEIVGWDGRIGTDVPETGEDVTLTATLCIGDEELTVRHLLTVFPSKEETVIQQRLQAAGDLQNEGEEGAYVLPNMLDGKNITWFREKERMGGVLSGLVLIVAILLVLSAGEKKKKAEAERQKELTRTYPALVGRIHLLYEAGLSTRRVFERLAKDHRRMEKETGKTDPAYEEIAKTWHEIENGIDIGTALGNFGRRCNSAPYRALSLLLSRTEKKGAALLLPLLEKEVQEANETRRRRARAEGEKTSTRLLFPMVLMLMVVLVILLVPATMSF